MRISRPVAAFTALLVYAGIFLMSSLPASSLPSGIPDFIPHTIEYAILAFFFIQMFSAPGRVSFLAVAWLLLALLGLLDEWHQLAAPGRVFSLLDLLYDTLGSAVGLGAFLLFAKHRSVIRN